MTKSMLHGLFHILLAGTLVMLTGCGSAKKDIDKGNQNIAEMRQIERELRADEIQVESHTISAHTLLQMDPGARKSTESKLARFVFVGS